MQKKKHVCIIKSKIKKMLNLTNMTPKRRKLISVMRIKHGKPLFLLFRKIF